MIYRLPEIKDKGILQAYVQEHESHNETRISASMGLTSSEYADWVEKIQENALVGDALWGKSLLYLCFDRSKLIGLLSIRYELPESLTKQYGHIGYGVRPSERKSRRQNQPVLLDQSINRQITLGRNIGRVS